ncbi:glycosyltransferase [Halocynthiibacter styelae]|uniref:Glycosyltransferase n=1 Tax=Halocynthiibacter styelae TaxID=2761955 RepID=A0A8J7LQ75_9RHOB|nr:glycosyltransferase [Paenihalocynthiibacter styelae]MBI1494711.1 glycosyltransferase [Paenihalocynthiibacter styelae]
MSSPRIRVTFVIQKLLGLTGGAERMFLQTAVSLAKLGMEIDLVIYDTSPAAPQFDTGGLTITNLCPITSTPREGGNKTAGRLKRIPHSGPVGHLKWAMTHGMFERAVRKHLKRTTPDVVIAFLPPAITAAVRAVATLNIPVIASTHNVPEHDFGLDSPRWDQNPVYRTRARAALSGATKITVLLEDFKRWLTAEEQTRTTVMPNPVQRLSPSPVQPADRENIVLAVGRLTDIKRYHLLIGAWAQLHEDFPEWRVDIYGEGDLRADLSAQITAHGLGDVVRLCGVTSDIGAIYDRARLLCHPAAFEGFGLSVAEAMAHGIPAMGFADCAGINQLITSRHDGFLIDPAPTPQAALTASLHSALSDPAHLEKLGQRAQKIAQTYQAEKIAMKWETLVRDCLS